MRQSGLCQSSQDFVERGTNVPPTNADRRMIEAGVRMVQVNLRGWDTHQNAFRDLFI